MNDLDRLRDDLHADLDIPFGPPDLDAVMGAGRGIRRRRHLIAASATSLAVVAVTGVVFSIDRPATAPVSPAAPASTVSSSPSALPSPDPSPTSDPSPPTPSSTPGLSPKTVRTGLQMTEGEFALYIEAMSIPAMPDIRFGIMGAVIRDGGEVQDLIVANDTEGSDVSPGFHAGAQTITIGRNRVPQFGYYAGPAARITGQTLDGERVDATLAEATVGGDPIVLYWFDPATAGPEALNDLYAYDADGLKLATGE